MTSVWDQSIDLNRKIPNKVATKVIILFTLFTAGVVILIMAYALNSISSLDDSIRGIYPIN